MSFNTLTIIFLGHICPYSYIIFEYTACPNENKNIKSSIKINLTIFSRYKNNLINTLRYNLFFLILSITEYLFTPNHIFEDE